MIKRVAFTFLVLLLGFGCEDSTPLPRIPVDITLDLNDPEFRTLAVVGNAQILSGTKNGYAINIIVKRVGLDEFSVFDQRCPYDYKEDNAYVVYDDASSYMVECQSCGTIYDLLYGYVQEAPDENKKKYPLLEYQATFYEGANTLRIKN